MTESGQPNEGVPDRSGGWREGRQEIAGYVLAVFILVVVGAVVRTSILNWIVGPGVVIASVWSTTRNRGPEATR